MNSFQTDFGEDMTKLYDRSLTENESDLHHISNKAGEYSQEKMAANTAQVKMTSESQGKIPFPHIDPAEQMLSGGVKTAVSDNPKGFAVPQRGLRLEEHLEQGKAFLLQKLSSENKAQLGHISRNSDLRKPPAEKTVESNKQKSANSVSEGGNDNRQKGMYSHKKILRDAQTISSSLRSRRVSVRSADVSSNVSSAVVRNQRASKPDNTAFEKTSGTPTKSRIQKTTTKPKSHSKSSPQAEPSQEVRSTCKVKSAAPSRHTSSKVTATTAKREPPPVISNRTAALRAAYNTFLGKKLSEERASRAPMVVYRTSEEDISSETTSKLLNSNNDLSKTRKPFYTGISTSRVTKNVETFNKISARKGPKTMAAEILKSKEKPSRSKPDVYLNSRTLQRIDETPEDAEEETKTKTRDVAREAKETTFTTTYATTQEYKLKDSLQGSFPAAYTPRRLPTGAYVTNKFSSGESQRNRARISEKQKFFTPNEENVSSHNKHLLLGDSTKNLNASKDRLHLKRKSTEIPREEFEKQTAVKKNTAPSAMKQTENTSVKKENQKFVTRKKEFFVENVKIVSKIIKSRSTLSFGTTTSVLGKKESPRNTFNEKKLGKLNVTKTFAKVQQKSKASSRRISGNKHEDLQLEGKQMKIWVSGENYEENNDLSTAPTTEVKPEQEVKLLKRENTEVGERNQTSQAFFFDSTPFSVITAKIKSRLSQLHVPVTHPRGAKLIKSDVITPRMVVDYKGDLSGNVPKAQSLVEIHGSEDVPETAFPKATDLLENPGLCTGPTSSTKAGALPAKDLTMCRPLTVHLGPVSDPIEKSSVQTVEYQIKKEEVKRLNEIEQQKSLQQAPNVDAPGEKNETVTVCTEKIRNVTDLDTVTSWQKSMERFYKERTEITRVVLEEEPTEEFKANEPVTDNATSKKTTPKDTSKISPGKRRSTPKDRSANKVSKSKAKDEEDKNVDDADITNHIRCGLNDINKPFFLSGGERPKTVIPHRTSFSVIPQTVPFPVAPLKTSSSASPHKTSTSSTDKLASLKPKESRKMMSTSPTSNFSPKEILRSDSPSTRTTNPNQNTSTAVNANLELYGLSPEDCRRRLTAPRMRAYEPILIPPPGRKTFMDDILYPGYKTRRISPVKGSNRKEGPSQNRTSTEFVLPASQELSSASEATSPRKSFPPPKPEVKNRAKKVTTVAVKTPDRKIGSWPTVNKQRSVPETGTSVSVKKSKTKKKGSKKTSPSKKKKKKRKANSAGASSKTGGNDSSPSVPKNSKKMPSRGVKRKKKKKSEKSQKVELFKKQFQQFAKFGDRRNVGTTISASNIKRWLKQAGVIDNKKLTTNDIEIYFIHHTSYLSIENGDKYLYLPAFRRKRALTLTDYLLFLRTISNEKRIPMVDITTKLIGCGPPSVSATNLAIRAMLEETTAPNKGDEATQERSDEQKSADRAETASSVAPAIRPAHRRRLRRRRPPIVTLVQKYKESSPE